MDLLWLREEVFGLLHGSWKSPASSLAWCHPVSGDDLSLHGLRSDPVPPQPKGATVSQMERGQFKAKGLAFIGNLGSNS